VFQALQECTTPEDCWELCVQQLDKVRVPQVGAQHVGSETLKLALCAANVESIADRTKQLGHPTEAQKMRQRMANVLESRKNLSRVVRNIWYSQRGYLDA
jgi:hypothetical protein